MRSVVRNAPDGPDRNTGVEFSIRKATNEDCERVQCLVISCLNEFGAPFDLNRWDADLVDIESSYVGGALFL
ncbi:MAG TPA: hypothetical protein VNI20_00955, partial [Fimbriimonadaceae bacterium]|nr:hypothetical protein [Fimbriimonadaceae bacterium]